MFLAGAAHWSSSASANTLMKRDPTESSGLPADHVFKLVLAKIASKCLVLFYHLIYLRQWWSEQEFSHFRVPQRTLVRETAARLLLRMEGLGKRGTVTLVLAVLDLIRPCHEGRSEIAADTVSLSTVGNVPYLATLASGQMSFLCQTLIFLGITSFNTSSILFRPRFSWGAAKLAQRGNNCVHQNVGDQWKPWWENGVIFALAHSFGVVWEQGEKSLFRLGFDSVLMHYTAGLNPINQS